MSLAHNRACLFFESRRWHHFGYEMDDESAAYVRALVANIGRLSGGTVTDDRLSRYMRLRVRVHNLMWAPRRRLQDRHRVG